MVKDVETASDGPSRDGKGSWHEMRLGRGREARANGTGAPTPGPSYAIDQNLRVAVELTEPDLEAAFVRDGIDLCRLVDAIVDGIAGI